MRFTSSYRGLGNGDQSDSRKACRAEIAILAIDRDAQRLGRKRLVTSDWHRAAVQRNRQQDAAL